MYERSAIVLEKYIEKILGFDKIHNLKENYINYKDLLSKIEEYQILSENEGRIIAEFDETVKNIEDIQKKQEKLCKENQKLEESRNQLFLDLGEDGKTLETKFRKVEDTIQKNNNILIELREEFVNYLNDFSTRQKERNKCEKTKRIAESNYMSYIEKVKNEFQDINIKDVATLKEFNNSDKEIVKKELNDLMTKNGKSEKIGFNQDVLKIAIKARINIAEKEAECYITIYDKMKKILSEIENDNLKLNKYKKSLRDVSIKLEFLNAEKEYIVGFLDYERMTTIAGSRVHKKKMEEACQNFELDMIQIHNLYELILREVSNKSTKKAYKELYNKTYLKNIEDKEKNFEEEVNNIKINMGTVINSNYWRIEGIKNVYTVFQEQITEKFDKDLSEYRLEEVISVQDYSSKVEKYREDEYYDEEREDEYYDEDDEKYDEEHENEYYDEDDEGYDEEYEEEYYDEDDEGYDEEYEDEYYDEDDEGYDEEYEEEYYDEDDERYEDEYENIILKTNNKENKQDIQEIDDDAWEKEIMQQLNRKRTQKGFNKKQTTNIFGKLFKDKNEKNSSKKNSNKKMKK